MKNIRSTRHSGYSTLLRMDIMKHTYVLIVLALILGSVSARSQDRPDSMVTKRETPADSSGSTVKPGRKGNDRFIDADGDGICDGRAKGLGLRRGAVSGRGQGKDATTGQKRWRGGRK